ncbi:MAG TPA: EAL domain-containing protein [Polyangiaceae bacterium]|jgi:EAL domain-containing protein (putative c-di-GMP-specific phosphodiesterase class I)|nr:EAL domain-containing protein [Polyangiaceae bacterium]
MGITQGLAAPEEETRILLVDDDAAVLRMLQKRLEKAGHRVVACDSGDEALKALTSQAFDVMVSDIQMPGTSGLNLLRAVREHDLDLPVVLMTGAPGVETATDAVEYGAFRYLIKPVHWEELNSIVGRAANIGHMARSKREFVEEFRSGKFRIGDRAGVDAMLDRALSSLWMAYQPIVRAVDSTVVAYEALMRVEEPTLPHPGAVLDAAERAGRIHEVGRSVRDNVVASAKGAEESWLLFVNLHPEELLDPSLFLVDSPFSALASRIVLEITERMSLEHVVNVRDRVAALRALGFQIALDDLGAGYAGLTSFTELEPEFVKLDMSLVRDIHQTPTKRKIVQSMVHLCHDMGKQIVAEGVESVAERDVLIELGCDLLQGYLFAKPGRPFPAVAS